MDVPVDNEDSQSASQVQVCSPLSNDASFSDEEMPYEPPSVATNPLLVLRKVKVLPENIVNIVRIWVTHFEENPAEAIINFAEFLGAIVGSSRQPDGDYYTPTGRTVFLEGLNEDLKDDNYTFPLISNDENILSLDLLRNLKGFGTELAVATLPNIFLSDDFHRYVYSSLIDMADFPALSCRSVAVALLIKINTVILQYCLKNPGIPSISDLQNDAKAIYATVFHKGFNDPQDINRLLILEEIRIWLRQGTFIVKLDVIFDSIVYLMEADSCLNTREDAFKVFAAITERMQQSSKASIVSIIQDVRELLKYSIFDQNDTIVLYSFKICKNLFYLFTDVFSVEDHKLFMLQIYNKEKPKIVAAAADFFLYTMPKEHQETRNRIRFFVMYFIEGPQLKKFPADIIVNAFYPKFNTFCDFDGLLHFVVHAKERDITVALYVVRLLAIIGKIEKENEDKTNYDALANAVFMSVSSLIEKYYTDAKPLNVQWNDAMVTLFSVLDWRGDSDFMLEISTEFTAYMMALTRNGFFNRAPSQAQSVCNEPASVEI